MSLKPFSDAELTVYQIVERDFGRLSREDQHIIADIRHGISPDTFELAYRSLKAFKLIDQPEGSPPPVDDLLGVNESNKMLAIGRKGPSKWEMTVLEILNCRVHRDAFKPTEMTAGEIEAVLKCRYQLDESPSVRDVLKTLTVFKLVNHVQESDTYVIMDRGKNILNTASQPSQGHPIW